MRTSWQDFEVSGLVVRSTPARVIDLFDQCAGLQGIPAVAITRLCEEERVGPLTVPSGRVSTSARHV